MNIMMAKLQRFGRIRRQLHTIISQETIKPSSPTPPHLKTYNLSLLDQVAPGMHMSFVFFYPNYKKGDTNILKKSLSLSLAQYYPFAGRFPTPNAPYIDCNDEGVEFLEASNDGLLDDFIHKNVKDTTIDQLFPYGLSYSTRASTTNLLDVQLNHFAGGGAAVALSISHKLADAATIADFINHWATVTCFGSTQINPCFISPSTTNKDRMHPFAINQMDKVKYATRRFKFSNSKVNELKNKVIAMSTTPINPTRVEVLASLLFKHAVLAATTSLGTFKPSNLFVAVNVRNKFVKKYPEKVVGSIFTWAVLKTIVDSSEIGLCELIAEVRKEKMEFDGIRDEHQVVEKFANKLPTLKGDVYCVSSVCKVPFYEADFGWGKPVEVTIRIADVEANFLVLMDTPSGDGITALVHLPEPEIAILEKDQEFVTYVEEV